MFCMTKAQTQTPEEEKRARKRAYNAAYYAANREKARASAARWLEKNRGRKRENDARYFATNRDAKLAKHAKWSAENKKELLVKNAGRRAQKSGLEFSITVDDLKWPTHCPVLGIELNYDGGRGAAGRDNSPSLDRWNNEVGYTPHNTVVISFRANSLKRDASADEVKRVAYYALYGRFLPPPGAEDLWGL